MSATIHPFPADRGSHRLAALHSQAADVHRLGVDLGTPEEWAHSAVLHLKAEVSGRTDGKAAVSVAALHLVLQHLEALQERLRLIRPGAGQ